MKITEIGSGLLVELDENDTERWANRAGSRWPCSTLAGRSVWARFNASGDLVDTDADEDVDGTEFDAIFSDAIASAHPDHPAIRGEPEPFAS